MILYNISLSKVANLLEWPTDVSKCILTQGELRKSPLQWLT